MSVTIKKKGGGVDSISRRMEEDKRTGERKDSLTWAHRRGHLPISQTSTSFFF